MLKIKTIGIIGYGHYGKLLHMLIRYFALWIDVLIYDEKKSPDGCNFATLEQVAACDAVILAVPMHVFKRTLELLLRQKTFRKTIPRLNHLEGTVIVNVCTAQAESNQILRSLVYHNPIISFHTLWGPEAFANARGDVTKLQPVVVTEMRIGLDKAHLLLFVKHCGFEIVEMQDWQHDKLIVARKMYFTHLISQVMGRMGLRVDEGPAPQSFIDLQTSAKSVAGDTGIFLDLWTGLPDCQATFDEFMAAVRDLEEQKNVLIAAK
jgi:prephenate dehydrogenase